MRRHLAFSFSSWFCVPEMGMKDFEILCRASCFIVPTLSPKKDYKYHVLTVSHAAAPWRWPKLYPDAWLQEVNEKNVIYTMEPRHEDGSFVAQRHFHSRVFLHPTRDLAVLHLEDEDRTIDILRKKLANVYESRLDFSAAKKIEATVPGTKELQFHGHNIESKTIKDIDDRRMIPKVGSGNFLGRTQNQIFYKTKDILVDGMCGGPVCDDYDSVPFANGRKSIVRGMLEGIVPVNHPVSEIQGAAVFVENAEILAFLKSIEKEEVTPIEVGEVVAKVAEDQDPDKLDITKTYNHPCPPSHPATVIQLSPPRWLLSAVRDTTDIDNNIKSDNTIFINDNNFDKYINDKKINPIITSPSQINPPVPIQSTTPSSGNVVIRKARFHDIQAIVNLRILVFFPNFMHDEYTKQKMIEKLRRRYMMGTTLLMAFSSNSNQNNNHNNNDYTLNVHPHHPSIGSGNMQLVGTVEVNAFDFQAYNLRHHPSNRSNTDRNTDDIRNGTTQMSNNTNNNHNYKFSFGQENKLYVADLAIRPEFRRLGIAKQLLQYIDDFAITSGHPELYLHVEKTNTLAQFIYQKYGYVQLPMYDNISSKNSSDSEFDMNTSNDHANSDSNLSESFALTVFTEQHLQRPASQYVILRKRVSRLTE